MLSRGCWGNLSIRSSLAWADAAASSETVPPMRICVTPSSHCSFYTLTSKRFQWRLEPEVWRSRNLDELISSSWMSGFPTLMDER